MRQRLFNCPVAKTGRSPWVEMIKNLWRACGEGLRMGKEDGCGCVTPGLVSLWCRSTRQVCVLQPPSESLNPLLQATSACNGLHLLGTWPAVVSDPPDTSKSFKILPSCVCECVCLAPRVRLGDFLWFTFMSSCHKLLMYLLRNSLLLVAATVAQTFWFMWRKYCNFIG